VSKKRKDEVYKITIARISSDEVKPAEISLIESHLGELLKHIIREADEKE